MDWDEARPKPQATVAVGDKLEALSVDDLLARIAALRAEIERVETELSSKRARAAAAGALFKS